MPILAVRYTNPKAVPEAAAAIAGALTDLTASILHKRPAVTAVQLQEIAGTDWFIGGRALAGEGLATFFFDIKVTAGTNTKAEIAAYIDAVYARFSAILGPVHEASYIVVDEVPAADWGYGGRTQEERFITGRALKNAA